MSKMSIGKKTLSYLASAVLLSALIVVASTLYLGLPALPQLTGGGPGPSSSGSTSLAGPRSLLVIQLTDPPQVPPATKSLNLTYSALSLLVGEPSSGGKLTTSTVSVTPSGGSATLNLLKLQNISQTIASANLPNGSVVYSVTFTVSGIAINVNGTASPVTLATGGSTFLVTISQPSSLVGENVALLQLNPVIVGTPSGYQLIPSAVGVIRHSAGQGQEQVGSQQQLTKDEDDELETARGNVTANLVALSVTGNSTTASVQVRNAGTVAVTLNAIGLHGNFTASGTGCQTRGSTTTTTTRSSGSTTTTTHGSPTRTETETHHSCKLPEHMNEVVFVPVAAASSTTSTTTATSAACAPAQMKLVNGEEGGDHQGFALQAGQCVIFTFSGVITFGESSNVLIPSTATGQTYDVHVIASSGANLQLTCVLPLGALSCKVSTPQEED